jgi:hypothetical protein
VLEKLNTPPSSPQESKPPPSFRTILKDIEYPQPATIILCDNTTAIGIATDSFKQKRTKAIDMRMHWIHDRVRQGQFTITYIPTAENLGKENFKLYLVHPVNFLVIRYPL